MSQEPRIRFLDRNDAWTKEYALESVYEGMFDDSDQYIGYQLNIEQALPPDIKRVVNKIVFPIWSNPE